MKIPRILISSVSGKSGKTTVTIALIKKLREHGLRVQPFKVGPDFIDPSYHTYFSGTYSRNLDSVMFSEETILASFIKNSSNSDVAVIEGVFGLYDSVDGVTEKGSTAEISKILRTPVILVINAERINRGLIPILRGFREFDRKVRIRGVIINNIANERQKEKIVKAFREEFKDVEVVGTVPRSRIVEEKMRYRHLGLTPVSERSREMIEVEEAIKFVGEHIEIDKIIEISREAEDLPEIELDFPRVKVNVRVGVMIDDVFSFYYPENVEYIQNTAQRIVTINS
ncbi:MAG: cobyrinate a,c-diamide synthase, partial [Nitrososphaerota archaeon]